MVIPATSDGVSPRPRVVVLADRVPEVGLRVGDHRLVRLLGELRHTEASPLITVVVADWRVAPGDERLLGPDVDVVAHAPDWQSWFAREHHDLVVVHGTVAWQRFGEHLNSTHTGVPRLVDTTALASIGLPGPRAPLADEDASLALVGDEARARDRRLLESADHVLCSTGRDSELVRELVPAAALSVVGTPIRPRPSPPRGVRSHVAVIGSYVDGLGSPDEDAARFLAHEVAPRVHDATGAVMHVLGEDHTANLRGLDGPACAVAARAPDERWLDDVAVALVLRRYGAPTPPGLFAAAEASVPIVADARVAAANGLPPELGAADDPEALARAVVELVDDDGRWQDARRALGAWAASEASIERYREALGPLLEPLGGLTSIDHHDDQDDDHDQHAWRPRTARRWAPDRSRRAAPWIDPLEHALPDQVTTSGLPDPEWPMVQLTDPPYDEWYGEREWSPGRRWALRAAAASSPYRPLVSIVTIVRDDDPSAVEQLVDSLRAQLYERWELSIVDDGSTRTETLRALDALARADRRVRLTRVDDTEGVVAASSRALARARGEFVVLLSPGGSLDPAALAEVVRLLNRCPELDVIYTDEHEHDATAGRYVRPALKPSWSPDLLLSTDYFGRLTLVRRALLERVGGIRPGSEGAIEYDVALRVTEVTDRVGHVALPLSVTPCGPTEHPDRTDPAASGRVLQEALVRRGERASVQPASVGHRVRYQVVDEPLVSIVIPTRDGVHHLDRAIGSIRRRSTYRNIEIMLIDNGSTDQATLDFLSAHAAHDGPVLRYPLSFNYARMMNVGAAQARGDLILFLNDDVEVLEPSWLEAMIEHAQRPTVGAVGARLLYPSGEPQHQGIFLGGVGGAVNAIFDDAHRPGDEWHFMPATMGRVVANFAAVTGACMMMRPTVLAEVGGLEERLHIAFNDVDLCLKIRTRGYEIVSTPFASLVHHESATRGTLHPMVNDDWFRERWRVTDEFQDPYCNPNYDQKRRFSFRVPATSAEPGRQLVDA